MYLATVLLMALATSVTVGEECGGALCAPKIDPNCKAEKAENMPCANLYFYNETGGVIHIHQGTSDTIGPDLKGVKGVAKVQTVGEYGCYSIYKKKNRRGSPYCWSKNDKMAIGPGTEYEYTIVRSAEYDPDCNCPSKAGIPAWAIAVSVLVVLLVAVAIFLVYKRKSHQALNTNEDGA